MGGELTLFNTRYLLPTLLFAEAFCQTVRCLCEKAVSVRLDTNQENLRRFEEYQRSQQAHGGQRDAEQGEMRDGEREGEWEVVAVRVSPLEFLGRGGWDALKSHASAFGWMRDHRFVAGVIVGLVIGLAVMGFSMRDIRRSSIALVAENEELSAQVASLTEELGRVTDERS